MLVKEKLIPILLLVVLNSLSLMAGNEMYVLVSKDIMDNAPVPGKPKANFSFICSNLEEAHNYIIDNMCGPNDCEIEGDITIYIRKGTYKQNHILWKATSPNHRLKIKSFENEEVIFDGKAPDGTLAQIFIEIANRKGRTNVWIEGLIVQNYANGIWFGNTIRDDNGNYFQGIQNSHNVIKNNVFRNIGNKHSNSYQESYSALGINNSYDNKITGNTFCHNENDKLNERKYRTNSLMHSIYLAHYSSRNIIKDNYFSNCSGDAIRLRNGCENNIIDGNYILLSGTLGFITEWYRTRKKYPNSTEEPSSGTVLKNNICAYPYPFSSEKTITIYRSNVNNGELNDRYIDGGNNFVIGGPF